MGFKKMGVMKRLDCITLFAVIALWIGIFDNLLAQERPGSKQVPPLQDLSPSRPGYRHTVTKESQEFYRYIMHKISQGGELTSMERLTIALMIANRSWPEPPELTEQDKKIREELKKHNTLASDLTKAGLSARGKLDYDREPKGELKAFRDWYHSTPPGKRPYISKVMMIYYRSLGFDMRSEEEKERERKKEEKREEEKRREEQKRQAELQKEREKKQQEDDERWRQGAEARDRLIEKSKQAKEDDPTIDTEKEAMNRLKQKITKSRKNWEQMTPQERREALKRNDPAAWEKVKEGLSGDKKSGDEVIDAIDSNKQNTSGGYDPLNDPNIKSSGPSKKDKIDIAKVDKLGDEFQKETGKKYDKDKDTSKAPLTPTAPQQTDSSNTTGTKTDETTQSPYPPYGTPSTDRTGTTKDWTKWATSPKPQTGSQSTTQTTAQPQQPSQEGGLTDVVVNSQDVTISVWDHGTVDGDIINILLNGAVIPGGSGVVLTKSPKVFNLKLVSGKNTIMVYAVNEGTSPPNTASIKISNVTSGKDQQTYRINQKTSAQFAATVQ